MRHMFWALCLSAVAALVSPRRVAACTCVATPIYRSDPADGATDVALNQAIMIEGVFKPTGIQLEDDAGHPVAFELNAGPWPGCAGTSADVIPKAPLAPNKRYTIRVVPIYPEAEPHEASSRSFTTGTTMLPDVELQAPHGSAAVVFDGPEAMCGNAVTAYTCLDTDVTNNLELILRRGQEVLMRTTTLVQDDGLYGVQQAPDCVELRRRARTGKRSAPLLVCGDALNARPWIASDSKQGVVQCRDGVIGGGSTERDTAESREPPPETSLAGSRAEQAGSRAEMKQPPPAADGDAHSSYGCAAARGTHGQGAGAFAMLMLALFARRRWQ